ncbi:hypothetical protein GC163_23625 [bacterium]|nr:hypothetical protein [bacterium]
MTPGLDDFASLVQRLAVALPKLERVAEVLKLPPLAGREWYDLLTRKLVPQLGHDPFLVVAVTGGTNIGKSVVFNHLAGERASASSPLASGTKHPVCLVPTGFSQRHDLAALFPSFHLQVSSSATEALTSSDEHWLFWRESPAVPPNLLLLDTPDVDSDAPVNWQRADAIRQSADVLVAVLTQQKYNDAAVKQFFRQAADEGKPAVVVFNQCELPDDEAYWPLWLETFCQETGVQPLYVYLAPNDRKAAEALTLEFQERRWPPNESADATSVAPVRLQDVFARLRFAEIKLQTLRGALELVADDRQGAVSLLREIEVRSGEFRAAAEVLTAHQLAEIDDWPAPPSAIVIDDVRRWWSSQRQGWSAQVHGVYNQIGQTLKVPFSMAKTWWQGPPPPVWDSFRELEWQAIVRAVGRVYTKLEWLADVGQPLLKVRLELLLTGVSRAEVLRQLEAEHRQFDFNELLQTTVEQELLSFREENPQLFGWFKRLDEATAAARPMLTIALGITGIGLPVGEAATHLASQSLMQGAMHVLGDVVAGTATATVGETAISATASSGAGYLQAKFHRLQETFTRQRVRWLAERLESRILGGLTGELQSAAAISRSAEYQAVAEILAGWRKSV